MKSRGSKAILHVCTRCQRKGSVAKRMLEKELDLTRVTNDLARATDEWLARARQLELLSKELHELHAELVRLKGDNKSPSGEVKSLTKESKGKMTVTGVSRSVTAERELSIEPLLERSESSEDEESSSDDEIRRTDSDPASSRKVKQLHPPGFKEIRTLVQLFSRKRGEDDFLLWL